MRKLRVWFSVVYAVIFICFAIWVLERDAVLEKSTRKGMGSISPPETCDERLSKIKLRTSVSEMNAL